MCDHPQYYRITDPLESLTIRIRLRKIFGRSVNFKRTRDRVDCSKKEVEEGSFRPGDEADIRFKWQEKVFGPREIIAISSGKHQRKHGTAIAGSHYSRLERDYSGHLEDMRREGVDPLETLSEVMFFTYTDKDDFVSTSNSEGDRLTTGDGGQYSYLEEAVANMPRKATPFSLEKSFHGEDKKSREGISETAAAIRAHLMREDKFKVMYIMVAVDVDVRGTKRIAKARGAAAASRERGGLGSFRRGEHDKVMEHFHERVLCSIKAHQNGMLEITPGFSEEEPESGDEGTFLADRTIKVMDKEGARLTSYRFTSPLGGVFSYTVENDAEPTGGVEEIEAWEAEESSRELRRKAARQQAAGTHLLGAPQNDGDLALHAFMEIVSASGFMGVERLYTEYALSLPRRWRMAKSGSGDGSAGGNGRGCGYENSNASRGDYSTEESFAAMGATQVAHQAYPLALPQHHPLPTTNSRGKHLSGVGCHALVAPESSSTPHTSTGYGLSVMPSVFHPGYLQAPSGLARYLVSSTLLCALALLWTMNASSIYWASFTAIVAVILALGGGAGGGERSEGLAPVAHFGFPVEFHLINEEIGEMAGAAGELPQLFFAVSSMDNINRHRVEGYGYVDLPRQSGVHELLMRTWRPICNRRTHLQDFFVGGAHRLIEPRYVSKPGSFKGTFLNRFGFRTHSSGNLRVRLHLVEQGHVRESQLEQPSGKPGGVEGGPNIELAAPRTVKGILRAVHAKRMSAEVGRRLSANGEPLSTASAAVASTTPVPPAAAATTTSTDPNLEVPETDEGEAEHSGTKSRDRVIGRVTDKPVAHSNGHARAGSRSEFLDPSKLKGEAKVEAAAELLARVREQLQRSEQRSESTTTPARVSGASPR